MIYRYNERTSYMFHKCCFDVLMPRRTVIAFPFPRSSQLDTPPPPQSLSLWLPIIKKMTLQLLGRCCYKPTAQISRPKKTPRLLQNSQRAKKQTLFTLVCISSPTVLCAKIVPGGTQNLAALRAAFFFLGGEATSEKPQGCCITPPPLHGRGLKGMNNKKDTSYSMKLQKNFRIYLIIQVTFFYYSKKNIVYIAFI